MTAVVLESVTKTFDAAPAVDGLSVRIEPGSVYGFLGPNGAGKTTAIRMMMNIIAPDAGRIEILGAPATDADRGRIGYMPEQRGLYARMTVAGVLRYIGAIKGLSRAASNAAAERWLDRVGLADRATAKVRELSRGMQQRLQFAATVISDPDLLILDEPFSGLDPMHLESLKAIMLAMRDEGKTILFSTHMMDEAQRVCDSILLINDGRAVFDGPLSELRRRRRSNVVVAEFEGDDRWLDATPGVEAVRRLSGRVELALADGADSQALLAAMLLRGRVLSFELKTPSLHEIFVEMVGGRR